MPERRQSAPDPTAAAAARPRITPAARRRALRLGIAADDLVGSGPGGRILLRDLEGATAAGGARPGTAAQWSRRAGGAVMARPARPPMAQVNVSAPCRIDALIAHRNAMKRSGAEDVPGMSSLFIKALGLALARVPAANVVLEGDRIVRRATCHVAYILADAYGQVAFPVIEDADVRTAGEISTALEKAIAMHRSRAGGGMGDAAGEDGDGSAATCAIANLGPGRVTGFDTAVSRPHAGVLAIPSPERVAVPVEGTTDRFRCETRLTCTLGCDSRLVSGLVAAQLLEAFIDAVETPEALFS